MAKQSRRVGRPRSNDSRVYGSGGTEIPYMRKDKAENYYTRWKDDNGGWHKKNLGRNRSKALLRYAKWEAERKGDTFPTIHKPSYLKSISGKASILLKEDVYKMLEEIGENYFGKVAFQGKLNSNQKSELKKVERAWNRFCKSIIIKTILEVNPPSNYSIGKIHNMEQKIYE